MSLCGSVMLISKMVFKRSFLVFIVYTNVIYAGTTYESISPTPFPNSAEIPGNEIIKKLPEGAIKYSATLYSPVEKGASQAENHEKSLYLLTPVDANVIHPPDRSQNGPYFPSQTLRESQSELNDFGKPVKGNKSILALITKPTSNMPEVEASELIPISERKENNRPVENIEPDTSHKMKNIPFTLKEEVNDTYLASNRDKYPVKQDPQPIHTSSYTNSLSEDQDILPVKEQDPIPPLHNLIRTTEHCNTPEEVVQEIQIDKFHEPIPPLSNHLHTGPQETLVPIKIIPEGTYPPTIENVSSILVHNHVPPLQTPDAEVLVQSVALPMTVGSHPAAVIATGPYPATVSVLNDVPVAHFAEPLPPLQNKVPTNLDKPKTSTLQVPQGPYPANLPVGHLYPPTV